MDQLPHFVIVGGGQSGGCAAIALREYGFEGKITLIAEEVHPPYERPPLSKDVLLGQAHYDSTFLNQEDWYQNQDVSLKLNTRIVTIDCEGKDVITDTGEIISYDKLLLATGGRVRRLSIPGAEFEGVHYLRGIDDVLVLKERLESCQGLAAIGGGFISLEIAAAVRSLGVQVTLLERNSCILGRVLENDVATHLMEAHRTKGVDLRTDAIVEEIVGEAVDDSPDNVKRATGVRLASGEQIPAELVVVGIGIEPNTELAEAAGLDVDNGIVVNEYGETSDTAIYACGDITNHYNPLFDTSRRLENWQNAQNQAAAVAKVMCGEREPFRDVPWFWSDQYEMNLQMVGFTDGADQVVVRANGEDNKVSKIYLKDKIILGAVAINVPKDIMSARKLIAKRACMDTDKLADHTLDLRKAVFK
jgi:3-phenylpropionate/trans-cinnamate dioxygenase ferredoxin reductase subunit